MISGLRSQREHMMTCVSERSGIASRGTCLIVQMESVTNTATNVNTMNLFLAENSMILSMKSPWRLLACCSLGFRWLLSMLMPASAHCLASRFESAFRVNQKVTAGDDNIAYV